MHNVDYERHICMLRYALKFVDLRSSIAEEGTCQKKVFVISYTSSQLWFSTYLSAFAFRGQRDHL